MNLRELEDFLETQEIAFTSILKATRNIDPFELKQSLTRHHAQMVTIAGSKYPMKGLADLKSPSPSPLNPPSSNKRPFTYDSDSADPYHTPTKPKDHNKNKKTPTSTSSSGFRASNLTGRLKQAGAGTLFKRKPSYTVSPSGLKDYDAIHISSSEGSDSEFAEAKENPNVEGSDSEGGKKKIPIRRGIATRKDTPAKKRMVATKNFMSRLSDAAGESDVETGRYSNKKEESSETGNGGAKGGAKGGKSDAANSTVTVEIDGPVMGIKKDITRLEESLAEKQTELSLISNVLARQPVLDIVRELKQTILSKKALLSKDGKSLKVPEVNGGQGRSTESKYKSMAATVEDVSESDSDTLFKSQTATRGSASKRRRV
ncbi:hypothetical protein ONS95_005136 [Cadophora gregata]|uniref:uncharacterized protein n=1 Tax=Cadophora gregata TaxID=51156 RepID=UPI0026DC5398|nr:uncharacterized protein ONS95_005136 [Cadophora gregata]KAK0104870.1 hypothetical protein ONS95_005136 [Cadophora gregata]KAK0115051.1 hypothetical protein ONS96_013521 [Cadophora gregata f. sp. sojae]